MGDLRGLSRSLKDFNKVVQQADKRGLTSAGFFLQKNMKKFVQTEGDGTWPERQQLSINLRKNKKGRWKRRSSADRRKGALDRFSNFSRYIHTPGRVQVGFAVKRRPRKFSPLLAKTISAVQERRKYTVDSKMRKALAASKNAIARTKRKKAVPGRDFFVAKEGYVVDIPARPIIDPIRKRFLKKAVKIYSQNMQKRYNREIKKRVLQLGMLK